MSRCCGSLWLVSFWPPLKSKPRNGRSTMLRYFHTEKGPKIVYGSCPSRQLPSSFRKSSSKNESFESLTGQLQKALECGGNQILFQKLFWFQKLLQKLCSHPCLRIYGSETIPAGFRNYIVPASESRFEEQLWIDRIQTKWMDETLTCWHRAPSNCCEVEFAQPQYPGFNKRANKQFFGAFCLDGRTLTFAK